MKILSSILFLFLVNASLAEEPNLIVNPNFENWVDGKPEGWAVAPGQVFSQVKNVNVEGATTALKVEVTKDGGESLGEIRQGIKGFSGGRFRFEGMFESTKAGLAIFMIKLRKDKTELKRMAVNERSGPEWTTAVLEFDAEDATEIQILCRFQQTGEFVGGTGAFTKLKLTKID